MPHVQTTAGSGSGRKEVRKMGKAMQEGQMGDLPLEELEQKEQELSQRLLRLKAMEDEIRDKEKKLKETEKAKKQILLRLSPSLWNEIAKWAEEDFRSINGQIEYLLSECVRQRKKNKEAGRSRKVVGILYLKNKASML